MRTLAIASALLESRQTFRYELLLAVSANSSGDMTRSPLGLTGKLYMRLIRDTYWGNAESPVALVLGTRR